MKKALAGLLSLILILSTVFSNSLMVVRADGTPGRIEVSISGSGEVQFDFYENAEGTQACPAEADSSGPIKVTETGNVTIPSGEHGAKSVRIKAIGTEGNRGESASGTIGDNDIFSPEGKLVSVSSESSYSLSVSFVSGGETPPSAGNAGDIVISVNRCSGSSVASYKIGNDEWVDITNGLTLRRSVELASVADGTQIYFKAKPDSSQILDTHDQNWYRENGNTINFDLATLASDTGVSITYDPLKSYEVQIAFDGGGSPGPGGGGSHEDLNVEIHSTNGNEDRVNAIEVKLGEADWTSYTDELLKTLSEGASFKLRFKIYDGFALDGFSLRYFPFGEGSPVDYKFSGEAPSESEIITQLLSDDGYEITFKPEADSANSDGGSSLSAESTCLRIEYRTAVSFGENVVVNVFFQQKNGSSYGDWRVVDGADVFVDGVGANEVRFQFNGNEYGGQGDPERLGYGVQNGGESPVSVSYKSSFAGNAGTVVNDTPKKYDRFNAGGHTTSGTNTFYMSDEDGLYDEIYIDLDNNGTFEDSERITPSTRDDGWGPYNYYERDIVAASTCNVLVKYHLSSRVSLKWSYTCDPGEDFYVDHGKIYIEKIKRGDTVLFETELNENRELVLGGDGIPRTTVNSMGGDYAVDASNGEVFVEVGDEVTVRLIPTYGYQVKEAKLNGWQVLEPNETRSSFTFIVGGNLHLAGNFITADDVISNGSSVVESGLIADGGNASDTGVLGLNISDNSSYANADAAKREVGNNSAESVATLDMELTSLVSKGNGDYWEESITEFDNNISVQIALEGETISADESYVVIREHNGVVEKIDTTFTDGVLTIPTNKFSTYSIYKVDMRKSIENAEVTLGGSLTYNGSAQTQTVASVKLGETTLDASTDYDVTGATQTDAGTYTLTVTGKGDYTGTVTKEFTIAKADQTPLVITIDRAVLRYGDPMFKLLVSGGSTGDYVQVMDENQSLIVPGGTNINIIGAGSGTITVKMPGNNNYNVVTGTVDFTIEKATPTITLGKLNQVSNAISAVTATLSPASADATVTIEYEVLKTPAKPCKYAAGHLSGCEYNDVSGNDSCTCGKSTHTSHDAFCEYEAAVYEWTTNVPTAVGEYNVRAYLTAENAGNNLNATGTAEAPAATGKLKITQYVAPVVQPDTSDSDDSDDDYKEEAKPVEKTVETPVVAPVIPPVRPAEPIITPVEPTTPEVREEVKAPEKTEEAKASEEKPMETTPEVKAEPDIIVEAKLEGDSKEAWASLTETILESMVDENGENIKAEVKVEMGETKEVPVELFEEIKGKDVDVVFEMDNGISWTVNGTDIGDVDFTSINLEVKLDKGDIPEQKIEAIADGKEVVNLSLTHDGEFGFKATLTVDMGAKNAGMFANLYYYNPETSEYEFITAAPIDENGNAALGFEHASDYTIVIDTVAATVTNNAATNAAAVAMPGGFDWPILLIGLGVLLLAIIVSMVIKSRRIVEQ